MKKVLVILLALVASKSYSQILTSFNWDNPTVFEISPSPFIRGYDEMSDSLFNVYQVNFYSYNNEYYPITSWADYYYWFTQKYWYRFSVSVAIYEYYYLTGNNCQMMEFVAGNYYLSDNYPSTCEISFNDGSVLNRLSNTGRNFSLADFREENTRLQALALARIEEAKPKINSGENRSRLNQENANAANSVSVEAISSSKKSISQSFGTERRSSKVQTTRRVTSSHERNP